MLKLDFPDILETISDFKIQGRSDSAAFLCWYLSKYYRLDDIEAVDTICDENGDKGIDGVYLNETDNSIDIFQTKISQKTNTSIGDKVLKEFAGSLSQFKDRESVQNIISTSGDTQLVKLISRLDLLDKIGVFEIRGRFLSNVDIDANGEAFLQTAPQIKFIGKSKLIDEFITDSRSTLVSDEIAFDLFGIDTAQYQIDEKTKCLVAPIKALELVSMKGIGDQSVFDANIRGHLGSTKVNKDIVVSVRNKAVHRLFPLFHNGITVICDNFDFDEETGRLKLKNYGVVNGCQSIRSLYGNRQYLTTDLRIMTRVIQVDRSSNLLAMITNYSNNQNGIKARDFKSNNQIQIRLQSEFALNYGDSFFFEVKRGEVASDKIVISNESAGQHLLSFDVKEPWSAHKKYILFDERYADIFGRPEVTADRIVMLFLMSQIISASLAGLKNQLVARYGLTIYLMVYMLRCVLERDKVGCRLIMAPVEFVREQTQRTKWAKCIKTLVDDMIVDMNGELDDVGPDFDYKSKMKSKEWCSSFAKNIIASYLKLVQRGRIASFEKEWEEQ